MLYSDMFDGCCLITGCSLHVVGLLSLHVTVEFVLYHFVGVGMSPMYVVQNTSHSSHTAVSLCGYPVDNLAME